MLVSPGRAQDGDGQVAHAGHDTGVGAGTDMGALLMPIHVADPVQPVLD